MKCILSVRYWLHQCMLLVTPVYAIGYTSVCYWLHQCMLLITPVYAIGYTSVCYWLHQFNLLTNVSGIEWSKRCWTLIVLVTNDAVQETQHLFLKTGCLLRQISFSLLFWLSVHIIQLSCIVKRWLEHASDKESFCHLIFIKQNSFQQYQCFFYSYTKAGRESNVPIICSACTTINHISVKQ